MEYATGLTIINTAAVEMGLEPVEDPYTDEDVNFRQLYYLLNKAGRALARRREWQHLKKVGTITPVNGQTTYSLPSDFRRMVNQTGWDRSADEPFLGPLTSQEWQRWVASDLTSVIAPVFRIFGRQFEFQEVPPNTLTYEYLTLYWVQPSGETTPTASSTTASADTVCFDMSLMVAALVCEFRKAKGMDATQAQADFDAALSRAEGDDSPAPVLSLSSSLDSPRMINGCNVPETGYGP